MIYDLLSFNATRRLSHRLNKWRQIGRACLYGDDPANSARERRERKQRAVFLMALLLNLFFFPLLCLSLFSFLPHTHTHTHSLSLSLCACLLSSALQCGFFFGATFFSNWRSFSVFIRQISKKIRQSRCEVAAGSQKI